MFEGFRQERITTAGAEINLRIGGTGPPVLLLHGFPQTHAMWHEVGPRLARRHTVVCPDLRGYGDSSNPPGGDDHAGYSKRAMAADQIEVMAALGFERFAVVGHDRGARVAHRLALDHAERLTRVALLDIVPTWEMFRSVSQAMATSYYHWFFLIQPDGLPERMIGLDPDFFLRECLRRWSAGRDGFFSREAVAEYIRCFRDPGNVHSACEDYRAGASIDLEHDEPDLGKVSELPLLVLWGAHGRLAALFDVPGVWGARFPNVQARSLPCGHFLVEERPDETTAELRSFLDGS
ncbi:MAG: alpha/beta hydrolase [Gaiellales bacterium]